jgi:hypothetical protein
VKKSFRSVTFALLLTGCPKAAPPAPESTAPSTNPSAAASSAPTASVDAGDTLADIMGFVDSGPRVGEVQLVDVKLVSGKLEKWDRAVAGVRGKYRVCCERGLLDDPKAKGNATFTVVVNGINGEVRSADVKGQLPTGVNACLQRATRNAQFEPSGAGDATLTYTLACTRHVD